jgi:hypothetical protein
VATGVQAGGSPSWAGHVLQACMSDILHFPKKGYLLHALTPKSNAKQATIKHVLELEYD